MKLVRFLYQKKIFWGLLKDKDLFVIKDNPFKKIKPTNQKISLKQVRVLPPASPSKIILVGLNYKDHAKELNMKLPSEPIIFLKPPTSLIGHRDSIIYPKGIKRLDYEAELALVIKKKIKNICAKEAKKAILGFGCLNDVTARDLQEKDGQWTRAKSFDTFCAFGPWIETNLDTKNLPIKLFLNGKLKQKSSTKHFIFTPEYLVSFISKIMTLLPGDIISTGTPSGIGIMKESDKVEVFIEGIGMLQNRVKRG